jgi:hypothetical protein
MYLPLKSKRSIAEWLLISVPELEHVDLMTQAEVATLLTAEYMAHKPPKPKE